MGIRIWLETDEDDGAVGLGARPLFMPLGIGRERVPLLVPLGERFPFQQVVQGLVRLADADGPEPGLADAVPLPQPQRDGLEPLEQCRQAAGNTVVDAQFVDHGAGSPVKVTSAQVLHQHHRYAQPAPCGEPRGSQADTQTAAGAERMPVAMETRIRQAPRTAGDAAP